MCGQNKNGSHFGSRICCAKQMAPKVQRVHKTKRVASGSTAPLLARNATRQAAIRARPGSYRCCPVCNSAVRVPDDAKHDLSVRCPLRSVRVPGVQQPYSCKFKTKPHCWRQRSEIAEERAAARVQASRDSVVHFAARIRDGIDGQAGLWNRVRDEAARRVPLHGEVVHPFIGHYVVQQIWVPTAERQPPNLASQPLDRILQLKRQWLDLILDGAKTLELRHQPLSGTCFLGCDKVIYGVATFTVQEEIKTMDRYRELLPRHRCDRDTLKYNHTWAMEVANVHRIPEVPYHATKGAIGIVKYVPVNDRGEPEEQYLTKNRQTPAKSRRKLKAKANSKAASSKSSPADMEAEEAPAVPDAGYDADSEGIDQDAAVETKGKGDVKKAPMFSSSTTRFDAAPRKSNETTPEHSSKRKQATQPLKPKKPRVHQQAKFSKHCQGLDKANGAHD